MKTAPRGLALAGVGTAAASVLVWTAGWGPLVAAATEDSTEGSTAVAAGSATATGVLVGYSDKESFYPGSPTEPPNTYLPYATGGFDNTGTGSAAAALAYNPYEDFAGAINGLAPPGSPEFPAGDLTARSRASVRGAPPQTYDASVSPEGSPTFGTMRATLDDDGPEARSEAAALTGEPAPGVKIESATSRIRVSRADGKALSVATTLLEGVTVNDVLTFDAVRVVATAVADGEAGGGETIVRVVGGAVNGTAVELTDEGLSVAGTPAPLAAAEVADALREAGIDVAAPGRRTVMPGGDSSTATALGPSLVLTSSSGQRVEVTVGSASAVALLFDPTAEFTPPGAAPEAEPEPPEPGPAGDPTTAVAAPLPPGSAASPPPTRPAGNATVRPPDAVELGTARGLPAAGAAAAVPDGSGSSATSEEALPDTGAAEALDLRPATVSGDGPRTDRARSGIAVTETATLAGSTATDRTKLLYGMFGGLAALLALGSLCVPRGDLWSDRKR